MSSHHQVLIIGGGSAGIMVAAQLLKQKNAQDVAIIEPADTHYYQPAWTLVGANAYDFEKTKRSRVSYTADLTDSMFTLSSLFIHCLLQYITN